jgi:hypothetical protein
MRGPHLAAGLLLVAVVQSHAQTVDGAGLERRVLWACRLMAQRAH